MKNNEVHYLILRTFDSGDDKENLNTLLSFLGQMSWNGELYYLAYKMSKYDPYTVKVGISCSVQNHLILKDLGYAISWFVNKKEDLIKMGYKLYSEKNETR